MLLKEKKISLRLDLELADRLQAWADKERVPVSYLLRHMVLRFLAGSQGPVPLGDAAGSPAAGSKPPMAAVPGRRPSLAALAVLPSVDQMQADFRREVCTIFDAFRGQGQDLKQAAKATNFAMKAKNHPWATYEVIADVLRKAGRFRKAKGVR